MLDFAIIDFEIAFDSTEYKSPADGWRFGPA